MIYKYIVHKYTYTYTAERRGECQKTFNKADLRKKLKSRPLQ